MYPYAVLKFLFIMEECKTIILTVPKKNNAPKFFYQTIDSIDTED